MLTTFDRDDYVYAALRAGASGFLLKGVRRDELVQAVRVVAGGDALLAPSVTRRLISDVIRRPPPDGATAGALAPSAVLGALTGREREVLELLGRGLSNAEIAGELVLSEHTVKTHVSRVLTKLGLRDRVHAVICAYENGITIPGEARRDPS
jgi:DNA-binding NarL/FixJ family response regulator